MKVVFEISSLSCDLALHPISEETAELIAQKGEAIYQEEYLNWWKKGATRTFGMRLDRLSKITLKVDDQELDFSKKLLYQNVYTLHKRMYLNSKAKYLALLGYDNEFCTFRWIWENVDFEMEKLNFKVTNWDRILNCHNYFVLDEVLFDNKLADDEEWLNPSGFTLIEPLVIDLSVLRQRV